MRRLLGSLFVLALGLAVAGCSKPFDGPTVDAFIGKLTHDGKPVSFRPGEQVTLQLFHEKGQSFNVPIEPDGSFKIGWMPIGKYSATLLRGTRTGKAAPNRFSVPGGLAIENGKTEYTIDLGKSWKS